MDDAARDTYTINSDRDRQDPNDTSQNSGNNDGDLDQYDPNNTNNGPPNPS